MKLGRNDPCPCGSGKKYKRCCLQADLNRERALQNISHPRDWFLHYSEILNEGLRTTFSENTAVQSAQAAWPEGKEKPTDPLFVQHALYDLSVTPSGPLISQAKFQDSRVTEEQLTELKAALGKSHMSLFSVSESKRGKGVHLTDKITGTTCFVPSPELAKVLEPMEVFLGRLSRWQEENILLPGWEKLRFHGRKKAIETVCTALEEDGLEADAVDERVIWLRREAARVTRIGREA